jgi:cyclopropane fatty-acyl-phospholipid synthase-like methyltransferase
MAQADELARALGLSPADRLLDIGTGRGWPGLYLADRTGVVVAAASGLPFRAGTFDAVLHCDVLC